MATRFGGRYSPDGQQRQSAVSAAPAARRTRAGFRANLMFFVPLPLAVRGFLTGPAGLLPDLAALALLLLAAWLTREGLLAQEAYEARTIARRPAIPRKIFGSVLTGAGLAVATWSAAQGLWVPATLGLLGAILHFLAFGPDPLRDKGAEGLDMYQQDRVARAVDEAEKYLDAMRDAILRAQDRSLLSRVEAFQIAARDMFRTVENDPRDLTSSRKYLSVYLMGARDATVKFADIYARSRDPKVRADYEALLDDLEKGFAAQTRALLEDDHTDLDVEISVLRERLEREGIKS